MAEKTLKFILDAENRTDKAFNEAIKSTERIEQSIKKFDPMFKRMALVGTAGFAAITGAIGMSVKKFIEVGDQIQKMSIRTGFAAKSLSELRYMADISGTSLESVEIGLKRMSVNLIDAARGTGEAADAFKSMGISIKELQDKKPEDVFWKLAGSIASIQNPLERAAAAQDIFGKAGTQLLPLFAEGSEGIDKMRKSANELGIVFDTDMANAAAELQDNMTDLKMGFDGVKFAIANAVLPAITEFVNKIKPVIVSVKNWINENKELFNILIVGGLVIFGTIAAIGILGKSLIFLIRGMKDAIVVLKLMNTAMWTLAKNPIVLLIAGLVALVAIVFKFRKEIALAVANIYEWVLKLTEAILKLFGLKSAAAAVSREIELNRATMAQLSIEIENNKKKTGGLSTEQEKLAGLLGDSTDAVAALGKEVKMVGDLTEDQFKELISVAKELKNEIKSVYKELEGLTKDYFKNEERERISFEEEAAVIIAQAQEDIISLSKEKMEAIKKGNTEEVRDLDKSLAEKQAIINSYTASGLQLENDVAEQIRYLRMNELDQLIFDYEKKKLIREKEYIEEQIELSQRLINLNEHYEAVVNIMGEEQRVFIENEIEKSKTLKERLEDGLDQLENWKNSAVEVYQDLANKANAAMSQIRFPSVGTGLISGGFMPAPSWAMPGKQFGGEIPRTGRYLLHRGEQVVPAGAGIGGGITVNIMGGYYLSERAAEEMGDMIINKLKKFVKI